MIMEQENGVFEGCLLVLLFVFHFGRVLLYTHFFVFLLPFSSTLYIQS